MAFVGSFKNPIEIECVLPPVFDGKGGEDEANDEGRKLPKRPLDNIVARAKRRKARFWTSYLTASPLQALT